MSTRDELDELLLHEAFVRRLARSLVRDEQRAEDLVQDTWVAALEGAPSMHVRGWLASVVRRIWSKELRGEERRHRREQAASRVEATDLLDEAMAREESRRLVVEALFGLTESLRTCLLLRYLEGLPPRRIASKLDLPVETVKTRLRRGLGQLREALDKRHGGDRATWMSGVAALAAPNGSGVGTGTFVIGGMAVGTMIKVCAAILFAAVCLYFVKRTQEAESPQLAAVDLPAVDMDLLDVADESPVQDLAPEAARRIPAAESIPDDADAASATKILRVILEETTDEYAERSTVTVAGVEEGSYWGQRIEDSWTSQGLTSEFDLDPFFARLAEWPGKLRDGEFVVKVDHPLHFSETIQIPLSSGVEGESNQTVFEVRVQLAEVLYWPELTLAVRDARTRAHLEDVELRFVPTAYMGLVQQPGTSDPFVVVGEGLNSPIAMRGGRKTGEPEELAAGLALEPAKGELLQPVELSQPEENARGVMMYARAPGHAWGHLVLDISKGAKRELLLEPGAALSLRVANVQLERYAALEKRATLLLRRIRPDGTEATVWSRNLDETLDSKALRIEALEPGEYAALVELSGSWQRTSMELGRETISIPAGETRDLLLVVPSPPEPPEHANLAGVVSFPNFGGEENVTLEFYRSDYRYGDPDVELSLTELEPGTGALPTWSFRLEDLAVDRYQVRLLPFLKSWVIELPEGGREDVELVIPELAEVLLETVDARTGEGIPLERVAYRALDVIPGQVTHGGSEPWFTVPFEDKPGRFRFWTAPGVMGIKPRGSLNDVDYVPRLEEFELAPGLQSMRLELNPACILRVEFRVDGAALPHEDTLFHGLSRCFRAVGHDARVGGMYPYSLLQASAPGLYEIDFDGVGSDRFLPIPSRHIEVKAGEMTEVLVELRRK